MFIFRFCFNDPQSRTDDYNRQSRTDSSQTLTRTLTKPLTKCSLYPPRRYNSGGKNFNEVHTKHLTVTIDAITIHSQLWSGKKIVPHKKDALLI